MHDDMDDDEFPLEIEWVISPKTLAIALYLHDQQWDIGGQLRVPTAEEIESRMLEMMETLTQFNGGAYLTLNGMKTYNDPEFPGSVEGYLQVCYASPRIPKDSK